MGHTCMSFNPKSHTSNPTTHNLAPVTSSHIVMRFLTSYVLNMQSGSSQPPIFSCTIRQFPTSYTLNIQSGSSRLPMFSMYKQAVLDLPCSQCSLAPGPTQILSRSHGEKSGEGLGAKLHHDRKLWTWLLRTVDSVS